MMAKVPVAGRVKTRLLSRLSEQQAADVQAVFLEHIAQRLSELWPGELIVCHSPDDGEADMRLALRDPAGARYLPQGDGDLGERLIRAAEHVLADVDALLFLGADSPDVPLEALIEARGLLSEHEVVLGPCADGGFWCLGLKAGGNVRQLLCDIAWSSGQELQQVQDRARYMRMSASEARSWHDVDHPEDVDLLVDRLLRDADNGALRLRERLQRVLASPPSRDRPAKPGPP